MDSLRQVFAVTGAGLMLVDAESQLHYVAATDTAAETLERVQEEVGVGPCIDAFLDRAARPPPSTSSSTAATRPSRRP